MLPESVHPSKALTAAIFGSRNFGGDERLVVVCLPAMKLTMLKLGKWEALRLFAALGLFLGRAAFGKGLAIPKSTSTGLSAPSRILLESLPALSDRSVMPEGLAPQSAGALPTPVTEPPLTQVMPVSLMALPSSVTQPPITKVKEPEVEAPKPEGGLAKCKHHRDSAALDQVLGRMSKLIEAGNAPALRHLLDGLSACDLGDAYLHNVNSSSCDRAYPEMSCSDLDYMARHRVVYEEPFYDRHLQSGKKEKLSLTILELALHMTRHANERILMNFLAWDAEHAQQHGGDLGDRIQIIRLLLESGFLWGSSDLVCHVVHPGNGYRSMVREAFARTILHDLVRDAVHLSWDRIAELRQSPACGGNNMDGVVWIGAQAPDSFTLTGLFNRKTVLMLAAEDGSDHDAAAINFPELVRLYTMMEEPLTTVNEYGWNAEMLAAAKLNTEHAGYLRRTVEHHWYQEYEHQFAYFKSAFLPQSWPLPAWLGDVAVSASLHIHWLAWLAVAGMLITVVLCFMLSSYSESCLTLQGIDMFFRVLWLLILNTAIVALPPIIAIAVQQRVGLFSVPSVSKWNPLPLATKCIVWLCFVALWRCIFLDWRRAREKASRNEARVAAEARCRYQDPECHLVGCFCVFLLVSLLMIIYLGIVMQPLGMNPKKTGLWLGSLLVQIRITLDDRTVQEEIRQDRNAARMAFDAARKAMWDASRSVCCQMGFGIVVPAQEPRSRLHRPILRWMRWACCMTAPSNSGMWSLHILACDGRANRMKLRQKDDREKDDRDARARDPWGMPEIKFRFFMSYVSNGLYRAILVYTLPLWLCRGSLVDFVLNAFALVYIVELDEKNPPETWEVHQEDEAGSP